MPDGCTGNCLLCGKCSNLPILDDFKMTPFNERSGEGYSIAVDLGTSTVIIALLDLKEGKIICRHSFYNPQRKFGTDVISRIHAANNGHLPELRQLITESIEKGIDALLNSSKIQKPEEMIIAGNTTMIHLLLGLTCESLGAAPFKPIHTLKDSYSYKEIFPLNNSSFSAPCSQLHIKLIPWISAFVGGDITSGLLFLLHANNPEMKRNKRFMLIDLGTNGEIALYDEGKLTVTSSAAGPAFEGAGGAADVIKKLADLVKEKKIDETGLLKERTFFSQKEIRDFQLAKSALRSGIEILFKESGLNYKSLDNLFLSGGIGQAVDVNDAAAIGIIPEELKEKTQAIGNSSLAGAVCFSLSKEKSLKSLQDIFLNYKEINLAQHPLFNDLFAQNMPF